MKTLIITICARRDSFGAYSSNCDGIFGAGDTIAEYKANILEAIRLIKETLPPERRNSKSKTKNAASTFLQSFCRVLSERGDSNARPLRPERSALPTALHPDSLKASAKLTIFSELTQTFSPFFFLVIARLEAQKA